VNVFRHYDVTQEVEFLDCTNFVEDFDEEVADLGASKKGSAAVAAEGDEVEIALAVVAVKGVAHRRSSRMEEKSKPAPLKTARVRHPGSAYYTYS
jgi:hypothetical protein